MTIGSECGCVADSVPEKSLKLVLLHLLVWTGRDALKPPWNLENRERMSRDRLTNLNLESGGRAGWFGPTVAA